MCLWLTENMGRASFTLKHLCRWRHLENIIYRSQKLCRFFKRRETLSAFWMCNSLSSDVLINCHREIEKLFSLLSKLCCFKGTASNLNRSDRYLVLNKRKTITTFSIWEPMELGYSILSSSITLYQEQECHIGLRKRNAMKNIIITNLCCCYARITPFVVCSCRKRFLDSLQMWLFPLDACH